VGKIITQELGGYFQMEGLGGYEDCLVFSVDRNGIASVESVKE